MDIQNISGATDIISRDFSINTNVSNENAKVHREDQEKSTITEDNKGKNIDIKA